MPKEYHRCLFNARGHKWDLADSLTDSAGQLWQRQRCRHCGYFRRRTVDRQGETEIRGQWQYTHPQSKETLDQ